MIDTKYFEIPDFCATQTRQCEFCSALSSLPCNANFGLGCSTPTACDCHDICVEEVRLIGTTSTNCEFTECISYPPIGRCRLGPDITFPIIDISKKPRVFVVCAEEALDSTCTSIKVKIKLLILAPTVAPVGGVSGNILIPLDIDVTFGTFFRFPDCTTPVMNSELQNELTQIDGSCLVIQLKAVATRPGGPGTTTQIVISGNIIDKLWKHENLWVTGIRPYQLSPDQLTAGFVSFTIPDVFNHSHKIGDCNDIPCPLP